MTYHVPVLLKESVEALNIKSDGTYVDLTFGGGGHSREILKHLGKEGKLLAFDQDADAEANIPEDERLIFIRSNFRFLTNWLRYYEIEHVDGILADLGVSSHHFDEGTRIFFPLRCTARHENEPSRRAKGFRRTQYVQGRTTQPDFPVLR